MAINAMGRICVTPTGSSASTTEGSGGCRCEGTTTAITNSRSCSRAGRQGRVPDPWRPRRALAARCCETQSRGGRLDVPRTREGREVLRCNRWRSLADAATRSACSRFPRGRAGSAGLPPIKLRSTLPIGGRKPWKAFASSSQARYSRKSFAC